MARAWRGEVQADGQIATVNGVLVGFFSLEMSAEQLATRILSEQSEIGSEKIVDPETGKVDELLTLPSGGDTSYPGLVMHDGQLWISYYSSHDGKSATSSSPRQISCTASA